MRSTLKAAIAALSLVVADATTAAAAPFAAGGGSVVLLPAAPVADRDVPAGLELVGGYRYGHGYGRPYHGRPHWGPHRPYRPGYGYYPRPRTKIVERRCSTRVIERTPYGRVVTVYRHCGRRW